MRHLKPTQRAQTAAENSGQLSLASFSLRMIVAKALKVVIKEGRDGFPKICQFFSYSKMNLNFNPVIYSHHFVLPWLESLIPFLLRLMVP